MSPQEIFRYCDALETALREYQSVVEVLISTGMASKREGGIAEHLSNAFHKVRQSYIPLEPILLGRTLRIRRDGREFSVPWSDVPTFRDIRTMEDFEATFNILDWLRLDDPFSGRRSVVHQELQGYFVCIDTIRREAERQLQHARDIPLTSDRPHTAQNFLEEIDTSHKISEAQIQSNMNNQRRKRKESLGKYPSEYEIQIYRVSLTGLKQNEIAAIMTAKTGIPCNQSKVSRAIHKVKSFLKKGNVLPDLSPSPSQKITVDPSKLEKGPRLDGRKPQR